MTASKSKTPGLSEPISHVRVVINDDEEVEVDARSARDNMFFDPTPVNETVMKCRYCGMVTVHEGYEFRVVEVTNSAPVGATRVYLCESCGKVSLK